MNNECMHNPNIQMQTGPLPADSLHNEHGCDQNLLLWGGKQLAGGLTIPDKESPKRYPNGMSVVTVVGHSRLHMRNTSCSSSSWYWPLRPIREEPIQSYTLKTGSVLDTGESSAEGSKQAARPANAWSWLIRMKPCYVWLSLLTMRLSYSWELG